MHTTRVYMCVGSTQIQVCLRVCRWPSARTQVPRCGKSGGGGPSTTLSWTGHILCNRVPTWMMTMPLYKVTESSRLTWHRPPEPSHARHHRLVKQLDYSHTLSHRYWLNHHVTMISTLVFDTMWLYTLRYCRLFIIVGWKIYVNNLVKLLQPLVAICNMDVDKLF